MAMDCVMTAPIRTRICRNAIDNLNYEVRIAIGITNMLRIRECRDHTVEVVRHVDLEGLAMADEAFRFRKPHDCLHGFWAAMDSATEEGRG